MSLVLFAVLKASEVELQACQEALEKREHALFSLSLSSQLAECLGDGPLCSEVRSAEQECRAIAARLKRELGEA